MVIEVLAADTIAVSIRIVAPAQDAGVRKIGGKKIAEPVDAVRGRPSLVSMPVQAMDGDNTGKRQRTECKAGDRLTRRRG
jgi:hypothetical protein